MVLLSRGPGKRKKKKEKKKIIVLNVLSIEEYQEGYFYN